MNGISIATISQIWQNSIIDGFVDFAFLPDADTRLNVVIRSCQNTSVFFSDLKN